MIQIARPSSSIVRICLRVFCFTVFMNSSVLLADVETTEERFARVATAALKSNRTVLAVVHHYPAAGPFLDGTLGETFRKIVDENQQGMRDQVLDLLTSNALTFVVKSEAILTNGNSVAESLALVNTDILVATALKNNIMSANVVTTTADSMIVGRGSWLVFLEPAQFTFEGREDLTAVLRSLKRDKVLGAHNWYKIVESGAFRMSSEAPVPDVTAAMKARYESIRSRLGETDSLQGDKDKLIVSKALEKDIELILLSVIAPLRTGSNPDWQSIEKSIETTAGRLLFDHLREDHAGTPLEISANEQLVNLALKRIDRIHRLLRKIGERESGSTGIFGISKLQLYRRLKKNRLKLRAQLREIQSRVTDTALRVRLLKKQRKTLRLLRQTGKAKKSRMLRKRRVAERRLGSLANLVRDAEEFLE